MSRIPLAISAALAVLTAAVVVHSGGPNPVRTTDHRVRYNAKEAKDADVEMSCRSMPLQEEFAKRGIINDSTHVMFLTAGVQMPVYIDRSHKDAVKLLKSLPSGTAITVYGKVHLGQGEIVPWVAAHNVRSGATSDPDEDFPKPVIITLFWGPSGQKFTMERGKEYTFNSPVNNEPVLVKWDY